MQLTKSTAKTDAVLHKDVAYPIDLGDLLRFLTPAQKRLPPSGVGYVRRFRAYWAGARKRKPRKGEWYFSGGPIEAFRAPNDLGDEFHIACIAEVEPIECYKVLRVLR